MGSGCKFPELTVKITHPTGWLRVHVHKFIPEATKDDTEKMFKILRMFNRCGELDNVVEDLRDWLPMAVVRAQAALLRAREDYQEHHVSLEGLRKRTEKYRNAKELNESLESEVKRMEKLVERMQDRKKLFEAYFGEDERPTPLF